MIPKAIWDRVLECPRCKARGYVARFEAEPENVYAVVRWTIGTASWFDRPLVAESQRDGYGCGRCP